MAKTSLKQHIITVLKDAGGRANALTAKQIEAKLQEKGLIYPHKAVSSRVTSVYNTPGLPGSGGGYGVSRIGAGNRRSEYQFYANDGMLKAA